MSDVYTVYAHVYIVPPQRSTIFDLPFSYLMVWDDNRAVS